MKKLLVAALLLSVKAHAWGPTGHRTVGQIASDFLTSDALNKVHHILDGLSLAKVSTWPDEIRSAPETYKHTFVWHYTDWPDEMHEHTETGSSGMLLTSIADHIKTLKNSGASKEKKAFALKFLVHLVGDLHMPLHVGNGLDQGGNTCKVVFHKNQMNLHALWDEGMIEFTKLSFTELSKFVRQGIPLSDVQEWKKGSPLDWAKESKKIRETLYPADVVPPTEPLTMKNYCRKDIVVTENEMPKLSYDYSYKFFPVVEKRLFQAGIRLAVLLNQNL